MELKSIKAHKHIIWDWNGTLLNDLWICMEINNGMLSKRELPVLDQVYYKEIFGFPIRDFYAKAGFNFDVEPYEVLSTEYVTEYDSRCIECSLHSGVSDILKKINDLGISQSILSASSEESLRQTVRDFGIDKFFTHINGLSNHYAESKVDIGNRWLASQHFVPCDVLFIGDTEHDYEVARKMGVDCILISHGHQSTERLKKCDTAVLESISQLEDLL